MRWNDAAELRRRRLVIVILRGNARRYFISNLKKQRPITAEYAEVSPRPQRIHAAI
jgi:hypothetical protein